MNKTASVKIQKTLTEYAQHAFFQWKVGDCFEWLGAKRKIQFSNGKYYTVNQDGALESYRYSCLKLLMSEYLNAKYPSIKPITKKAFDTQ